MEHKNKTKQEVMNATAGSRVVRKARVESYMWARGTDEEEIAAIQGKMKKGVPPQNFRRVLENDLRCGGQA